MKLAVNYSPQAAALVRARAIEVDYFKCPDWPDLVGAAEQVRPVYVHFPFVAGRHAPTVINVTQVKAWKVRTSTRFVNTHLDPEMGRKRGLLLRTEAAIDRAVHDVQMLVDRFGADVVVENVPYWQDRGRHERVAARPEVIRHVVEETGCGLLLDLGHARLAARGLGMTDEDYLSLLPVRRLRELHVAGVAADADGWLRDHMPMQPDDWDLLEEVLERIGEGTWSRPAVVAFEYGGVGPRFAWRSDPDVLAEQVPRLRHLVRLHDAEAPVLVRLSA